MISNYPDNFTDADAINLGIKSDNRKSEIFWAENFDSDTCDYCGNTEEIGNCFYCKMD